MKTKNKLVLLAGSAFVCLLSGCVASSDYGSNNNSPDGINQQIQQDSQKIAELRFALQKELPSYSNDYVKRIVEILGTCQKSMQSPRYMMGSICSDASSQLDALKLDFPQQRMSVANEALGIIINKIMTVVALGEPSDFPSGQYGYLFAAKPPTEYAVNLTQAMRDVLLNQAQ